MSKHFPDRAWMREFDISNVTLKELEDMVGGLPRGTINEKMYRYFIEQAIEIKIIDEMNKTYFGSKITLKNKLPQAEVVEEMAGVGKYFGQDVEPLFPVMKP